MYHPDPLNWIAGDDMSFFTAPPHEVHAATGASEYFWITSKRDPQASHWYS
jgi:hypothetical protein